MTLAGTQTYVVGSTRVAIIDPGPLLQSHIDAVAAKVGSRVQTSVLVTHAHPDHDEAAQAMADKLGAEVVRVTDGTTIETDSGDLTALATPGHTADHFCFLLESERAVFCGDLMMGGLDTALVAPPEGNLRDYLHSLERVRQLEPSVIHPAHGPAISDPAAAVERYVQHRIERINQVASALQAGRRDAAGLVDVIYGAALNANLRPYAASAVEAYLEYLELEGRARRSNGEWSLV